MEGKGRTLHYYDCLIRAAATQVDNFYQRSSHKSPGGRKGAFRKFNQDVPMQILDARENN